MLIGILPVLVFGQSVYATSGAVADAPVLISPMPGSTLGDKDTVFVWHPVPGANSYRVQVAVDSARFMVVSADVTVKGDTTLRLGSIASKLRTATWYYWHVSAIDSSGAGLYSITWSFYYKYAFSAVVRDTLDATFAWFLNNPPNADGSNFNARWNQSYVLDYYGWQLSNTLWNTYRSYWSSNPPAADNLEDANPILYYLRKVDQHAFDEIRHTTLTQGAIIWEIYNVGMVVKTKNICFAIDLVARGSQALTDLLDFAIVSHTHSDHDDGTFVNAMKAAGKPVYAPFSGSGLTFVDSTKMPAEYNFGEVNIRFTFNHQEADIPVLVSQINLGASADNYTLYYMADARSISALHPTRHVNFFQLDIANGYDPILAAKTIGADMTLYGHEMELGHSTASDGYRWTYDYSYAKISSQPRAASCILTWGERLSVANAVVATSVGSGANPVPVDFRLAQNFPNPFNPTTTINYQIPSAARVNLGIYDLLGRQVRALVDGNEEAGSYSVRFDAGDLASGIYLCRINAGAYTSTVKMLYLR